MQRRQAGKLSRWTTVCLAAVVVGWLEVVPGSDALQFGVIVPPRQVKCYGEILTKHTLYTASVGTVHHDPNVNKLRVTVTDPIATVFSDQGQAKFRTAFTTLHAGAHQVCVENQASVPQEVDVSISWGAEAKDYQQIAKKNHLDETTTALTYIEDLLRSYHRGLLQLRSREHKLRQIHESTSRKLLLFFGAGFVIVVAAALVQYFYFRNFLRNKKII